MKHIILDGTFNYLMRYMYYLCPKSTIPSKYQYSFFK